MYLLYDLRGHDFGYYDMMVFNELPATVNVMVHVPVLHNASPSGCLLPFQGRVSLVVWLPFFE